MKKRDWTETPFKGIALLDTRTGQLVRVGVDLPLVTWRGQRRREYNGTVFEQVEVRLQMRRTLAQKGTP